MNKWIGLLVILCIATKGVTQSVNYEEEQVPPYALPGLWNSDRQPDSAAWLSEYRPPLLDLLAGEMFGHIPNMDMSISIGSPKCDEVILDDKVRMQEYPVSVRASEGVLLFHILIFSPVESNKPSPVFLGLNFVGNHTIFPNAQIGLTPNWIPERKKEKLIGHTATDASRGTMARRWPVEAIVARGYAVATVYCGEFDPDFDDGFSNAAHALTAAQRTESSWGTIAAWAWGLSRALDALEDISHIDASRVAVLGHSRLG
ncbi:MAG: hypothetical protein KTR24_03285 [Saprospiraceae bacterium]|nr:hypothetical protein [Saprospiraceae bacterium]